MVHMWSSHFKPTTKHFVFKYKLAIKISPTDTAQILPASLAVFRALNLSLTLRLK